MWAMTCSKMRFPSGKTQSTLSATRSAATTSSATVMPKSVVQTRARNSAIYRLPIMRLGVRGGEMPIFCPFGASA
jgi:hypothetical protein